MMQGSAAFVRPFACFCVVTNAAKADRAAVLRLVPGHVTQPRRLALVASAFLQLSRQLHQQEQG